MATGPLDAAMAQAAGALASAARQTRDALGSLGDVLKSVGELATTILPPLKVLGPALEMLGVGLGAVGKAVRFLLDPLGVFAAGLGFLARTFGAAGVAAGKAAGAFAAVNVAIAGAVGALVGLGQSMTRFVSQASPAAMQQWNLVLADLSATVGAALLPLFELLTQTLRVVADSLTLLIPAGRDLAVAMQPLLELLAEVLTGAIGLLSQALKVIVPVLGAVVRLLADFARWLGGIFKEILAFLGVDLKPDEAKKGASVGMAARPAQIGSVDSVLQAAMRNAFSVGLGAEDPAKQTASGVQAMKDKIDQIYSLLKSFPDRVLPWLEALPGKIHDALADLFETGMDKAEGVMSEFLQPSGGVAGGLVAGIAANATQTLRYLDDPLY